MNYGRYNRSVTVLSGQGRDFAAADGQIAGYLKVETGNNKGAMRCSVENLRPYPKGDYVYKLILFGNRGERTIHSVVGTVPVGRSGNGEGYFRFDPNDVDGRGNDYMCFSTAVVAAVSMKNDREPLHPVLKGNTGNEPEARPLAASVNRSGSQERNGTDGGGLQERNGIDEGGGEKDAAGAMPDRAEQAPEAVPGEEGEKEEINGWKTPEALKDRIHEERKQDVKPEGRCFNGFYNEYILHACAHTCQVAEYYEEVKPFAEDRTGARWKKIMNIMNLPLVSPGAHYFASLYHHYIFGARPDQRGYASCYFFGIPGRKMDAEQPDGGRSGFVFWQPVKGAENQKNPYGYWIVEIDGRTGDIREVTIEMAAEV